MSIFFFSFYFSANTALLKVNFIEGYSIHNPHCDGIEATIPAIISKAYGVNNANGTPPENFMVKRSSFLMASAPVETINYKKSQGIFKRETAAVNEGALKNSSSMADADAHKDPDLIKRVRLRFYSPEGGIRPLLLGFTPNNAASDGVDYGYDALNYVNLPSDLLWMINGSGYVIQGVGVFDTTKRYPFAMKMAITGDMTISLTDLENFDATIDVFVYDSLLNTYHQINTNAFTTTMDAGNYDNRFFLTFNTGNSLSVDEADVANVMVNYLMNSDEIYIKTPKGVQVKQVSIFNLLGQTVKSWDMKNTAIWDEIRIPANDFAEGSYIIKVETESGLINKQVIIKH